ncbi:MAG: DUF1549 domain-containing protein, partial [Planctomycetaceae bacterium]|nr:DUF1549 domain-containing protein [Planctomycetaceae bacterium]
MQRFPLLLQHVLFCLLPLLLGISSSFRAATADEQYLNEVKPLLERKCYACHGSLKQEGELRLDTVELIKRGGDSGGAFDESDWKKSLLWERVTAHIDEGRMPPEGEPLSESELARLQTWLAAGAKGPAQETAQVNPKDHWSFQPLQQIVPPADSTGKVHPIDAFLQQILTAAGLKQGERAEPHILVRRLFLDLHGLPPAPEDLEHWSARLAESERGVEELIDTLLSSPRYGERIAQRWLDLVRYADTHGFEVNTPRPNAWPYRDYVIEAFNEDRSYQDFIREQLIGDQLGVDAA